MIERLDHIVFFELDIDLNTFRTLDDFRGQDGHIDQKDLKKNFEKMMRLNSVSDKNIQKSLNSLENCLRVNNIAGIEHLLTENLIEYVDNLYNRKLKIKIRSYFKNTLGEKEIDLTTIEDKKFDNPDFIEACKMSKNPSYNKQQIQRLLLDYLTGQYDQSDKLQQYNTEKNKNWLKDNLTPAQQQIWLAKNRKVIERNTNHDEKNSEVTLQENKEIRIKNHIEVAIKKIQEINTLGYHFQTDFTDKGELKKYYNTVLKKEKESIKSKEVGVILYADLKFQIDAIVELDKNVTGGEKREISRVIIEKELDPLKCLMMGNWVDGSCMSFYSSVGNYYSAISNTIDANKGVYYIRDERGTLLGRCLITLGNDGKISRYKMYYSGNVSAPIDTYFDKYTANLAQKMDMELNGAENEVEEIECDAWYKDGIKTVV
ncbi:hypothetical protein KBC86_01985 [Candidatus Gracilibacteria bacterium]|nr:hypothetical protein [Candidatus Gracilibacteria bacterium]